MCRSMAAGYRPADSLPMNTPARILTALAAAGAAAFLPLSSRFHEVDLLEQAVAKKTAAAEKLAAAATQTTEKKTGSGAASKGAAGMERIPAGDSPADAGRRIQEACALDG